MSVNAKYLSTPRPQDGALITPSVRRDRPPFRVKVKLTEILELMCDHAARTL